MARISGRDGEIMVGGEVVSSVQTFSIDESEATSPVGAMGDELEPVVGGLITATGSASLLYDYGSAGQDAIQVGEELESQFDYKKGQAGSKRVTGRIRITKVGDEVPYNDSVKVSVEFHFQTYTKSTITGA